MNDDDLYNGLQGAGMSDSWTNRYIVLLNFVREQRNSAIAFAEGHEPIVAPLAPDYVNQSDLEAGYRLLAVLEQKRDGAA